MAKIKETLGSTLAFRRALEITDASMSSVSNDGKQTPIQQYGHGMRTTKAYDTDKKEGQTTSDNGDDSSNLSYLNMAKLNSDNNTLNISFSVTFLPIYIKPEMADNNEKFKLITEKNKLLLSDQNAVTKVADYYAFKLLNGSWAWRNRDVSTKIDIEINTNIKNKESFKSENVQNMPLHPVLTTVQRELGEKDPIDEYKLTIKPLSNLIKASLLGESEPLQINIQGQFAMQNGATVYPSQLFMPEIPKVGKSPLGRKYFEVPFNNNGVKQVGITAEKINNALRKYDLVTDENENETIISIEPNGSDIITKKAYRGANKRLIDLYKVLLFGDFEAINEVDRIFLIGSLIRGGLFQEASTKAK